MLTGRPISGKRARELIARGPTLVFDTRDPVSYRNGTLPGAVNVQLRQVSTLLRYPKTTNLIFVGTGPTDDTMLAIVNYAIQYGFTGVFVLSSIDDWNR